MKRIFLIAGLILAILAFAGLEAVSLGTVSLKTGWGSVACLIAAHLCTKGPP